MKYIDIHCHLGFPDYDADREELLAEMQKEDVAAITVGVDLETSKIELEIAKNHENVWACIGVHPEGASGSHDVSAIDLNSDWTEPFRELANDPKVVAIGECGLDFFRLGDDAEKIKKAQKDLFEKQIDLALEAGKPLMLHIRPSDKKAFDAYFESLEILKRRRQESGERLKGNAHFFVGNTEVLKGFLDIGFTASFTGVVTFADEYDEAVRYIPQDRIMSETDAPFVAPAPFRGKRNNPIYVKEVVKRLSEIRGESVEDLNRAILSTAKSMFGI